MIRCRQVFLLAIAAMLASSTALFAQSTLVPFAHYRLGEEDLGTPTPGGAPELGLTLDEVKYNGIERDLIAVGTPVYSNFVAPGGYSTLSMKFDGNGDVGNSATQWHNQPPGTFRIGMEAWVWIDPVMQGSEFVPFGNGSGMGFIGTADGKWTTYGTGGFPLAGDIRYGEWQHIAFATNGSQWNFYLDGVQTVFAHGGTYGATTGDLTIGGDAGGSRRMVGYVDEARLFRWTNILPNQLNLQIDDLLIYSQLTKGDVNGDGVVDVADYDVWRSNVGTDISDLTGIESLALGNVNHDGRIDLTDFALIKANQTPGAAPVPEPATWALALLFGGVLCGRRMSKSLRGVAVAAIVMSLGLASTSNAQLTAQWDGSDANWTGAHWTGGSGPGGAPTSVDTAEFLGGTATINSNVGQYSQLVTRAGGTINIAPTGSVIFDNANLGATGGNGAGVLNVQGSLDVPGTLALAVGDSGNGNATSHLNVSGSGKVRTATLDAFWATPGARVSMNGPNTDVQVGDFFLGISTLEANITALNHAPLKATNSFEIFAEGSILPGSKLEVHFDLGNVTPTLGHSWSLVESPTFANTAINPPVNSGAVFKPQNVQIDFLDVPGLRAELAYKPGGSLGQVLAVDVLNNLNLKIDPATGAAKLENSVVGGSAFTIDGLLITSASGSLNAAGYDGLGLAGWQPGLNQSGSVLSESNLLGSTPFAVGTSLDLGSLFEIGGTQDLVFEFHVAGGSTIRGTVEYTAGPVGTVGDTDNDGDVDLDDLNAVRNHFGGTGTVGSTAGDAFPYDGIVDLDDLNAVRNNFGATQAVPEPSSIALALGLSVGLIGYLRRRR